MAGMEHRSSTLIVGRESELAALARVLDASGPRVLFVYGIAGIGKSSLLTRFRGECEERGVHVVAVDCGAMEPTQAGFIDAVRRATSMQTGDDVLGRLGARGPSVLLVDTYEVFRIADPWLRNELLPALGSSVRVVVAGREPPMLEWATQRGEYGGFEVLPLGPLDARSVESLLCSAGLADHATTNAIAGLCRGHPLALRLAIEARIAGGALPVADAMPRVVEALAALFREGLDDRSRRVLDAASVPRRITSGVLAAMLGSGENVDAALDLLRQLSFVGATADGLRLHDAVQAAIAERLRAIDPVIFRTYRTAAWQHLQTGSRAIARHELARSTADLLYLVDNPVVREAFFPTTAHAYSVEALRVGDDDEVRAFWHGQESEESAAVLDQWLARIPSSIRVVRDRFGKLAGCSVVALWRDIPQSFERFDPVLAGFATHAPHHRLPAGQTTLVLRRVLSVEGGEGPSSAQAAAWLDVKRDYLMLRPHLGRVYTTLIDPTPFIDALIVLGFTTFGPAALGPHGFHLAALDFGPGSVDGWLARLGATELGIDERAFLDPADRTAAFAGARVQLSPLEFGVMTVLAERPGRPVARAELLERVWGSAYDGGSNVVDVVVRGLRRKAGDEAHRIETARGIGYRLSS